MTPWTAAYQAPPSLGFSRQEHWSGLPFPSPMHESESQVTQSCLTLSDPMDCSLPGSSIHGIFQARVLELGAIAFSAQTLRVALLAGLYLHTHPTPRAFYNSLPHSSWFCTTALRRAQDQNIKPTTTSKLQAFRLGRETTPEQHRYSPHLLKGTPSFFHPFGAGSGEFST